VFYFGEYDADDRPATGKGVETLEISYNTRGKNQEVGI
jgi:hypothetical protein